MPETVRFGPCMLLALALGASPDAWADAPRTSSLSWTRLPGAEQCIPTKALASAVEHRLGRAVFVSAAQGDVSVEGRVQPDPQSGRFSALLTVTSADGNILGTRELRSEAASCRSLDDELALVIALLIDPEAALRPPPPASQPAAAAAPPAQVVVRHEPVYVPVPGPREPPAWSVGIGAGPLFALGLLPGIGIGLGVHTMLEAPWLWPVEISGTLWLENEARAQTGGVAQFRLATGGLALCPISAKAGRTRAFACAGGHLGSLRMRGQQFEIDREQEVLAADVAMTGRVVHRIAGPMTASAALALLLPLQRDRFYVRDSSTTTHEVFRMAPVATTLGLALGVDLP
jgi:hypothetical protein